VSIRPTTPAAPPPHPTVSSSLPALALAGAALGLGWGVAARGWMRLIATEPEFSWSGTGYIVGACTMIGLLLGIAEASRRRGGRRWRRATAAAALLLGAGAGILVVPTALLGGLAAGLPGRHPVIRTVLALAAAAPALFVAHEVWRIWPGPRGAVAIVLWVALAATLALAFSVPWRQPATPIQSVGHPDTPP
jgi:hypothetical protein